MQPWQPERDPEPQPNCVSVTECLPVLAERSCHTTRKSPGLSWELPPARAHHGMVPAPRLRALIKH